MSKTVVTEIKTNDIVSIEAPEIRGYQAAVKLSGVVRRVYDQQVNYKVHKYVELFTNEGIKGVYLALTDEVVKTVVSDEEKEMLMIKPMIRSLPRVVGMQGSDPEIFVVNKDNQVIPAFDFLNGKDAPNRISENNEKLFWDGFQAEFNLPAQSCLDSTLVHTYYGLKHLNRLAKQHNKNARLTIQPTFEIAPHILREAKEEHVQFGCMPSKNVYGMEGNKADGRDVALRSAGGHIHLQLETSQKKKIEQYVKALDAILGVACVSFFGAFDDSRRREYYGLAGEYRTPSHGLEYRTLSNVWMCHPTAMYIVYELARKIISMVDQGYFKYWKYDENDVIDCINTCNIPLACEMLKQNEDLFKDLLHSIGYNKQDNVDVMYAAFMTGVENLIEKVDDIEGNWNLNGGCRTSDGRISEMRTSNPNFKKLLEVKF